MALTYRQMIPADLPAVLALRVATRQNAVTLEELEQDYGITEESLAAAMQKDVAGWLCEEDGEVAGFAMGDRGKGEVQVVALRPESEGRGIGRHLLALVRDWLFAEGHEEIWLRANPDPGVRAHGFYRRLGWRLNGEMIDGEEVMVLSRPDGANAKQTSPEET